MWWLLKQLPLILSNILLKQKKSFKLNATDLDFGFRNTCEYWKKVLS